MYHVLKRMPVLLPLAWTYRVIEMLVKRGGVTRYKVRTAVGTDNEYVARQAELFNAMLG